MTLGIAQATPSGCPAVAAPVPINDQRYRTGTNPRHTLDIYPAPAGPAKPIVITVHGGGWIGGDNSGKRIITCITQALHDLGYAVFSINYRQATPEQDGVPMQTNDITVATKWVKANGAAYGGDTSNITLLGGSSGAQLVALAGLLINKAGQPPVLRGVIEMSGVMDFPSFFNQPGQPPPGDEQHTGASTYLGCAICMHPSRAQGGIAGLADQRANLSGLPADQRSNGITASDAGYQHAREPAVRWMRLGDPPAQHQPTWSGTVPVHRNVHRRLLEQSLIRGRTTTARPDQPTECRWGLLVSGS